MTIKFDQHNWQTVMVLLPIYGEDGGNYTEVWFSDGSKEVLTLKTKTVLKQLAGVFAIDLSQMRRNYKELLGRSRNVPLPLHKGLWLVPFQVRTARSRNDGSVGYIVYQHIEKYTMIGSDCCINFYGGQVLQLPQQSTSVNNTVMLTHILGQASES